MNSPKEIANNYIAIGKGKVNTPVANWPESLSHLEALLLLQPLYLFRWHL